MRDLIKVSLSLEKEILLIVEGNKVLSKNSSHFLVERFWLNQKLFVGKIILLKYLNIPTLNLQNTVKSVEP